MLDRLKEFRQIATREGINCELDEPIVE
jgi:flagellar biosynthesis/type III secretory pathway chaperone